MKEWLDALCGTGMMPHGSCYLWEPGLVGLHAIADSLVALAYFSIPLTLVYFVRKRRDLPHTAIFLLFGAFIVACGTTHFLEVWTIWHPHYWISGSFKLGTAGISLVTAVALVRIVPNALNLPSPEQLRALNQSLEERVQARTAELALANEQLLREVSQRKEAEAEVRRLNGDLRRRVNELQALFEVLPVGVGIASDATCRHIASNPALSRMLGLPPRANVSLSPDNPEALEALHVEVDGHRASADELPMHTAVREGRTVLDFEETVVRKDGERVELLANAVPLRDGTGAVFGCVATFQDITERKRGEERRRDMDRKLLETQKLESLGVLAGGIAHDFNNLLTGVIGNASLARMDLPVGSPVLPAIDNIESAGRRAADLCRQMLAYSGRGRFLIEVVDLNILVREIAHLLSVSISKQCTLQLNLARSLAAVSVDATQIRQVVMNLVINASEAIGAGQGSVTLTTGEVKVDERYIATVQLGADVALGDYVFLEVSDNGCGMDAETVAKIFDPFFTTKFSGRGLGLAAVMGIVRGHQGALKVYSEVGVGTTFKILLPRASEATAASGPREARPSTDWRDNGTVLVVDDDVQVRKTATALLQRLGYEVEAASDGQEGIALFSRAPGRFRFVLLDLTMPRLDGEATFRQLKQLNSEVDVILMSGFNHQDAVARFTGKGLAGFVQKPFEAEQLITSIRRIRAEI